MGFPKVHKCYIRLLQLNFCPTLHHISDVIDTMISYDSLTFYFNSAPLKCEKLREL